MNTPSTYEEAVTLRESVAEALPALTGKNQFPGADVGRTFNAILKAAKEANPDSSVVADMDFAKEDGTNCGVSASSLIAMLDQIMLVEKPS